MRIADNSLIDPALTPWLEMNLLHQRHALVLLLLASALAWGLVFVSGGTKFAYTHVAYLPIVLGAFVYGWRGGVALGLTSALLMGPFMPLDVETDTVQPLHNWTVRGLFFVAFGTALGTLFQVIQSRAFKTLQETLRDELTGFPTRAYFETVHFQGVSPGSRVHVILFNDISRITSTFGQEVAVDTERAAVAELALHVEADQLFRISPGGYLLTNYAGEPSKLVNITEKPIRAHAASFFLSPTIGTATVVLADDGHDVLRRAVSAAELAHETGVQHLEYSEEKELERRHRLTLLGDLREAIEGDELYLCYQPKIRLADHRVIGCEALLRWNHPERGFVPPGDFIPVAEYSSLMTSLTFAVVDMAVAQLERWRTLGINLEMSINVSVRNLMDPDFADALIDRLSPHRPLPLSLEITESAAADPSHDVFSSMLRLADAGLELHVDDYGTGMSSLAYLKKVPATQIKIDQTFIRNCARDPRDRAMVRSTIRLCQELGLAAVAEGVEDAETAELLRADGCHYAQGYFYAKPMSAAEIVKMVQQG